MPRRLQAARARVSPARREAYLALVAELAAVHRAAGGHFWLFEREARSGEFLEFAEHGQQSPGSVVAPGLRALLAEEADYGADRDVDWCEVRFDSDTET
jgi:hypothetical protein